MKRFFLTVQIVDIETTVYVENIEKDNLYLFTLQLSGLAYLILLFSIE
jgi:hypothetical protein